MNGLPVHVGIWNLPVKSIRAYQFHAFLLNLTYFIADILQYIIDLENVVIFKVKFDAFSNRTEINS